MSHTADSPLPIQPRHLLGLWTVVLLATLVYCELGQAAYDNRVGLTVELLWNVKVWTVWIAVSVMLATRPGRSMLATLWKQPLSRVAMLLCLPALALVYEWSVGAALDEAGWMAQEHPAWMVLYKRLPLYALALLVLAYLGRRLSAGVALEPTRAISDPCITVSTSRGAIAIAVRDIEVVTAAENYVEICLADGRRYLHRATLTRMGDHLGSAGFVRVHRSVIVNPHHVTARLPHRRLKLRSGRIVRIGRAFGRNALALVLCAIALMPGDGFGQAAQPEPPQRPLLYFFEHVSLREAAFRYDEDIQRLIANPRQAGEPVSRLFAKAALYAAKVPTFKAQTVVEDMTGFMRQIGFETLRHGGYTLHVMAMPKPEYAPEAYFVAIVYKDGEPLVTGTPAPSTRYLVLEKTPVKGRAFALAEWDANGKHKTHGFGDQEPTVRDFVSIAFQHLGVSGSD